jgi:hypothetical protein
MMWNNTWLTSDMFCVPKVGIGSKPTLPNFLAREKNVGGEGMCACPGCARVENPATVKWISQKQKNKSTLSNAMERNHTLTNSEPKLVTTNWTNESANNQTILTKVM